MMLSKLAEQEAWLTSNAIQVTEVGHVGVSISSMNGIADTMSATAVQKAQATGRNKITGCVQGKGEEIHVSNAGSGTCTFTGIEVCVFRLERLKTYHSAVIR